MRGPRRTAARALVVFVAALVLSAVAAGCSEEESTARPVVTTTTEATTTTTTTEAPLEAGEILHVYEPRVGDCFDRRRLEPGEGGGDAEGRSVILRLPCELPHTFEVFATFDVDPAQMAARPPLPGEREDRPEDVNAWPGEDALEREANLECPARFAEWAGEPYERSELEVGSVLPNEAAWGRGARWIGCTVFLTGGERLTGSQEGRGRGGEEPR